MKKKKVLSIKDVWAILWAEYKVEWKLLWCQYKSLIIPFIEGTAKYIWQLVYGMIKLVVKGLYRSGKILVAKLIAIIKKA